MSVASTLFSSDWRDLWAGAQSAESTGAIFTKVEIVDLILDLVGYSAQSEVRLASLRVLEPSCGDGAFVTRVVTRLIENEQRHHSAFTWDDDALNHALTAADINQHSITAARGSVVNLLVAAGCPLERATNLAANWIIEADFLVERWGERYDVCVGNPPYVRIEALPRSVLEAYRGLYSSMGDRADLYVAFVECGLQLLSPSGKLGFIVANRWTKNQYGRTLRAIISESYHVHAYLDLAHTQPFLQEVSAYPCIVVIDRHHAAPTFAATLTSIDRETLDDVRRSIASDSRTVRAQPKALRSFPSWYQGSAPWVTTSVDEHEQLSALTQHHPTLEASAPDTRVGIGVATGADRIFILRSKSAEIEAERQIKLAMPSDVKNHGVEWSGCWVVNPFRDDGGLVDLDEYPGLRAYFETHRLGLSKRHVAKAKRSGWYRTIDRIWPALTTQDKLLIRDIQDPANPVVGVDAPGAHYPHHNLYFVTSASWPLRALQCLLRSDKVVAQVAAHSVAMRGGSIRWQAQVLRRLRIPELSRLSDHLLDDLSKAAAGTDTEVVNALAAEAYEVARARTRKPRANA
jgi:adenine-specific DNA-methyltransferase